MTNHLRHEKSPYLLQHAENPVDWYPWGEEAFARASREDKPVFLSIGYSTCHWCHVMAHESFEDEAVAALLNEAFVCIKVDREERPDIDGIYMTVCQMMTGSGGWPLTVVMTPDRRPFFAATYVPKESRWGRMGLVELIPRLRSIWETRRDEVEKAAAETVALLKRPRTEQGDLPVEELLSRAAVELGRQYDHTYGGFGDAPKFPMPHQLVFLMRHWRTDRGGGGPPDGRRHPRRDAPGRNLRSARLRIPPLQHRPSVARARTSRRCSTIRPSSPWLTPRRSRRPATRRTPGLLGRSSTIASGTSGQPRGDSSLPRMPTARGRRGASTSGRWRRSAGSSLPRRSPWRRQPSPLPRRGTSSIRSSPTGRGGISSTSPPLPRRSPRAWGWLREVS